MPKMTRERLEEEIRFADAEAHDLRFPKDYREGCLRDLRQLEKQLKELKDG